MYKLSEFAAVARGSSNQINGVTLGETERQSVLDSVNLLDAVVNKHFIYGFQALSGGKGYLSRTDFTINETILRKASAQVKKITDEIDNELRQIQETGEVTLGFKDEKLHTRVTDIERRLNEIVVYQAENSLLKERVAELEDFVTHHTDNMLALEHLLNRLIEQTNVEKANATTQCEAIEENKEVEYVEKIDKVVKDDNFIEILFFLSAFVIFAINIIYMTYKNSSKIYNTEHLDNRPAIGTKMLM
jgi:hypothetical protein